MELTAEITLVTVHRDAEEGTIDRGQLEIGFHRTDYSTSGEVFDDMTKLIDMFVGRSMEM